MDLMRPTRATRFYAFKSKRTGSRQENRWRPCTRSPFPVRSGFTGTELECGIFIKSQLRVWSLFARSRTHNPRRDTGEVPTFVGERNKDVVARWIQTPLCRLPVSLLLESFLEYLAEELKFNVEHSAAERLLLLICDLNHLLRWAWGNHNRLYVPVD